MDGTKGRGGGSDMILTEKKTRLSTHTPCDVEALRKCLEENNGDGDKCKQLIDSFKSSCSISPSPSPAGRFAP